MCCKFSLTIFKSIAFFVLMFLVGVLSFNLFYLPEKLEMIRVVNEFHEAQIHNDKKLIDNLLTDDFLETGARHFVQTPEVIRKSDVMKVDFTDANVTIEAKYALPLSVLSGTTSLSAVREITLPSVEGKTPPSVSYYVTYTFEKTADGLKISGIKRKM